MGTAEKKLDKMHNNPKGWHINDLLSLADPHGIEVRTTGGSHYVFSHKLCPENLSVPANRPIKPAYIKQFTKMIGVIQEDKS